MRGVINAFSGVIPLRRILIETIDRDTPNISHHSEMHFRCPFIVAKMLLRLFRHCSV